MGTQLPLRRKLLKCSHFLVSFAILLPAFGLRALPSFAAEACSCISCHGSLEQVHGIGGEGGNFSHAAVPGSGQVTLFSDNGHDSGGWEGDKPYFAVSVECAFCHNTDLPKVHGGDCGTCHPTPYDTVRNAWSKTCQQGGCHAFYHGDSIKAHLPFDDPFDPSTNDCNRCHDAYWNVPQSKCGNCHLAYTSGDVTPPVTSATALSQYVGPAKVDFSIKDSGKVGIGRTFYRLDGGDVTAAGKSLFVDAVGSHTLEFWSKDQAGNNETNSHTVSFNVVRDSTPPTTTSDVQSIYYQSAVITLHATDASTLGVKTTSFRLDGGAAQTGTTVLVPAVNGAAVQHTLTFWSEDWSGNAEAPKAVNFTVMNGAAGTIRLVWGDSDVSGSPCFGDPEAWASWLIRKGGWTGAIVASGSGGCPGWSGVADVAVPVGPTPYFVIVDWWNSAGQYDDATVFPSVYVTDPGQVKRLSY